MVVDVGSAFIFVGIIILVGFLGSLMFRRLKVPDIIILLLVGLLVGPVLYIIDATTISYFKLLSPFFAALALVMLLFEGGLQLNFYRVLKELSRVSIFTVLVFTLTTVFTAGILHLFGWDIIYGLLMGAIVGGTSSAIVVPLMSEATVREKTRTVLDLESALTDALCVIVALALIQVIISANLDIQTVAQNIAGAFSIAIILGLIAGVAWLKVTRDFKEIKKLDYLLTIAVLFLLYGLVEFVRGNGAIAALTFGLVLGNYKHIGAIFRMDNLKFDTGVKLFHSEISFFIKTFFFVYLGIIFDLGSLTYYLIGISVLILGGAIVARYLSTKALTTLNKDLAQDSGLIVSMLPRGLAAAVLATYPLSLGLQLNNLAEQIVYISFLVILLSNILTTFGVYFYERKQRSFKKPDKGLPTPKKQKTTESEKESEKLEPVTVKN